MALPVLKGAGAVRSGLSRREFVQLVVIGAAGGLLPSGCDSTTPPQGPTFFTAEQRQILAALADYVLPPDQDPGGSQLGAVSYIETLLTALQTDPPRVFAGGPLSGRNPFPLSDGAVSTNFPPDSFQTFLPLTREQLVTWKLYLYGSAGVPGGGPNDALLGPVVGLRQQFQDGLGMALSAVGTPMQALDAEQINQAWGALPASFQATLTELVVEAAFGAPEYGGNPALAGWNMIHTAGDTSPLGYTQYDQATGTFLERAGFPYSTKDPAPDPDPMSQSVRDELELVVAALSGRSFY